MPEPAIVPVQPSGSLPPAGHYSPGIVHGGLVYVSGQLPIGPSGEKDPSLPIDQQLRLCLANVARVLEAAGSDLSHTLRITLYVSDLEHWSVLNRCYAEVLGEHRPARTTIPCGLLHHGFGVEVDAIAALRD